MARKLSTSAMTTIAATSNGSVLRRQLGEEADRRIPQILAGQPLDEIDHRLAEDRGRARRAAAPATMPSTPMVRPTVMKTFSTPRRDAPIVRRMAMSRVLARTSMISEERMLNTATRMMIERTHEHHHPLDLERLEQGRVHRAPVVDHARGRRRVPASGARISPTRSASTVLTSIMPTASPSIRKVCASSIGMTTNALSKS